MLVTLFNRKFRRWTSSYLFLEAASLRRIVEARPAELEGTISWTGPCPCDLREGASRVKEIGGGEEVMRRGALDHEENEVLIRTIVVYDLTISV